MQQSLSTLLSTLCGLCAAGLVACGGDADTGGTTARASSSADADLRNTTLGIGPSQVVTPLLDDEGRPAAIDSHAEPADPGARTRSGRYASDQQARQLTAALGARAVELDVGCCDASAVDQAVGIAWGLQAAADRGNDMPVLVRGTDLRLAAAAANRLAEGGLTHVWLVTP